jgi:hypothetical protein
MGVRAGAKRLLRRQAGRAEVKLMKITACSAAGVPAVAMKSRLYNFVPNCKAYKLGD